MRSLKIISIGLGVIIIILLGVLVFVKPANAPTPAGGAGQTGQPQFATSPDGRLQISLPQMNVAVKSPLAIEGSVIGGGWFFEASFPIKILDADGAILGTGKAQALGDWTSTGTVPFSASIVFTAPHYASGTILFANDNPSGLPANARSFSLPVDFK
jgi:Immunoglobulin-like domain of bacterial spore germination